MNNELRIMNNGKIRGFTLIEALVSMAIIGVVGFILVDLMTRSFQGSNKTALLGKIKQNGQTAMNIMDSKIRNADSVLCISTGHDIIVVQNKDVNATLTRFYYQSPDASTAYIAQDAVTKNIALDYEVTKYCTPTAGENPLPAITSAQILTDKDAVKVEPGASGLFNRSIIEGVKDSIVISFKVVPKTSGVGFSEQSATVPFQTTINLR